MTFLEFWNTHFVSLTSIAFLGVVTVIVLGILIFKNLSRKNVKTPWFEIAPDRIWLKLDFY